MKIDSINFKKIICKLFCCLLISLNCFAFAADSGYSANEGKYSEPTSEADALNKLVTYVYNLGTYLGFTLTQPASTINATNLESDTVKAAQLSMVYIMLGAIPVNAFNQALAAFVPTDTNNPYQSWNGLENATFKLQNYNTPDANTVSVSKQIDQKGDQAYQPDPVTQAVANILLTPDYSYCMNYDGTEWTDPTNPSQATWENCPVLVQNQVKANVIGTLPSSSEFFKYNTVQSYISQLNSNTLVAPLLYSTQVSSSSNTQSTSNNDNKGLSNANQSQAQQAANFVRYASGNLPLISLAQLKHYDLLYTKATRSLKSTNPAPSAKDIVDTKSAQATLATYLTSLRIFAAQASIPIGNMYYILSKRLPQSQDGSNNSNSQTNTSQALSEFKMATWRLNNPAADQDKQWIDKLNAASEATVQKEIAILLSEMNYQMYLSRQLQERLLLTNSLLALQMLGANRPSLNDSEVSTLPTDDNS